MVAREVAGALLCVSSVSRASRSLGRARFSCLRAARWRGVVEIGVVLWFTVFWMSFASFFLGEDVPDWAARGVADQGQRSNVAYLEAAAVSLNARR